MAETVTSQASLEPKDEDRLAACYNCKRSKLKCVRPTGSSVCTRCRQRQLECTAPAYHVGRHKGVKNKHSGLEKAVIQIEQALKRTKPGADQVQNPETSTELRYLLDRSRELLRSSNYALSNGSPPSAFAEQDRRSSAPQTSNSLETPRSSALSDDDAAAPKSNGDQLNLDGAENPLQLLARTSELLSSISNQIPASDRAGRLASQAASSRSTALSDRDHDMQRYFGRFQPRLDVGEGLDPIDLGLVSLAEAESLFNYFYDKLAHTRWGVDPVIHTVEFVRSRSAFLLTSIAAASALFLPSMESLYKRLANHRQYLAGQVMSKRYKSVEIVLAFMVNVPWTPAGEHCADDDTSTHIHMALTVAMDLSLNKIIVSSSSVAQDNLASSDCVDARKALGQDGFGHIDPNSLTGRRLLRRRERTWLSLFVLERGTCLARGRDPVLPISRLIETCDQWHVSELADIWDGSIVSVAVLRRDLAKLIVRLRAICDTSVEQSENGALVESRLKGEINSFFDKWYATWPFQIGDREQLSLPPYVEILASHTRLSLYSLVLNHATAPPAARHFFRAAGVSSALNVLRVAVQGEQQLKTMPNNTAIMISFAACFAMRVSTAADGHGSELGPGIRTLIAQTTDALERIGATPTQRKGVSCLFARQLRHILRLGSRSSEAPRPPVESASRTAEALPSFPDLVLHQQNQQQSTPGSEHAPLDAAAGGAQGLPSDQLLFSAMSNDQLDEALNNTGVNLDALWDDFQFQNGTDLDWMDWSAFA